MSITLNWGNPNPSATAILVYRSATPIVPASPGTALVTLAGTATTYTDATAADNTLYYYCIAVQVGGETVFGNNQPLVNMLDTGPGPQSLVRGNWNLGFFGKVAGADLFASGGDFMLAATGNSTYAFTPTGSLTGFVWYKLAYKGKVVFVPCAPVAATISGTLIAYLYNKGLFYGTADYGAKPSTALPTTGNVMQNVLIPKGAYNFIARVPKISDTVSPAGFLSSIAVTNDVVNSELSLLIIAALPWALNTNIVALSSGLVQPTVYDNAEYQTMVNASAPIVSQQFANTAVIYTISATQNGAALAPASINLSASSGYYWPILELVP